MSVVIETTVGDITVDLYCDRRPQTCLNFFKLCKIKYYNLCLFHKIEKNFIAQTGDPLGTGRGGESVFCHLYGDQAKYFEAEFKPRLKHEKVGTLSMVNNGNNMNGSQFFLTLSSNLTYLDENHVVFGEVVEGFDVLLKLNDAICDNNSRPYQDIRITHTVILHDPFEDPKGLEIPDRSPEPAKEMLESTYIAADEEIDDNKGLTAEEIEEKIKESEAKARATILEMVGDIPEADVKPPENVLFVCKLNPVTTSEDLEVIFSRFGPILSCEVIKDKKTGESLQYAFIEFEKEEHCENAYFKMDNVLIDDRRIHVDFSQSVSKMNWNKSGGKSFKSQNVVSQNIVLKDKSKKSDGYDLIFDTSNDNVSSDEGNSRSKSKTRDDKNKSESKNYSNRLKTNFRSNTLERRGENKKRDYYDDDKEYKKEKYDKYSKREENYSDRHYKKDKYDKYSEKEERRTDRYKTEKYDTHIEKEGKYTDRHHKNEKSDKYLEKHRHRDSKYYSSDRNKDSDSHYREAYHYSSKSPPKSDRKSEHRKSYESKSKSHKLSDKKRRNESLSPDRQKKKSHYRD